MTNGSKNPKRQSFFHFDPIARVTVLRNIFSRVVFVCLTPILSVIVWVDKLHNCVEGICFFNMLQRQKCLFLKKRAQKLRNKTFLPFMTTFYNFALKLETGCGTRVFRLILETRNVSNLCLCVRFIFPDKTSLFIRASRNE